MKGTDYTAKEEVFDITIAAAANSGSATFKLTPIDDTLVEAAENITLSGGAANLEVSPTSVTLTDDETRPYVVVDSPRVQEGDSSTTALTFTARLPMRTAGAKSPAPRRSPPPTRCIRRRATRHRRHGLLGDERTLTFARAKRQRRST